ncbi:MAG: hypothetical protein ACMZ7B_07740 [Balneola sp.]
MKKTFLISIFALILFIPGCSTSDSFGDNYVTLKSLNGWCLPACVSEFTVTPSKTFYKESGFQGEKGREYSAKTSKEDWQKIEFYLETTGYRTIKTEPTCARCYDGNDYVLKIQDGRFSNEIYYTWGAEVEQIEDFDSDLRQMQSEFLNQFNEAVPE